MPHHRAYQVEARTQGDKYVLVATYRTEAEAVSRLRYLQAQAEAAARRAQLYPGQDWRG